jgi:uncharacterized protein YbjT (DUF2867 family)
MPGNEVMHMASKILVTGGIIGDQVVSYLMAKRVPVRVTVRKKKANPAWDRAQVEQVEMDFSKPDTLLSAFEGVEKYFSVSPLVENLVEVGIQAILAAKAAGVKHIVRSSGLGAGANAAITLGRWHGAVEKAVVECGVPWTILQPTSFMQNYLMHAGSIQTQGAFYAPLGDGKASLLDVRDLGEVAGIVLTSSGHQGKRYALTGGEAVSCADIARIASEVLGKPVRYVAVSDEAARTAMKSQGMPYWLIDCLMELNGITKAGYVAGVSPDTEAILGRKPTSFRKFMQDYKERFSSIRTATGAGV